MMVRCANCKSLFTLIPSGGIASCDCALVNGELCVEICYDGPTAADLAKRFGPIAKQIRLGEAKIAVRDFLRTIPGVKP